MRSLVHFKWTDHAFKCDSNLFTWKKCVCQLKHTDTKRRWNRYQLIPVLFSGQVKNLIFFCTWQMEM